MTIVEVSKTSKRAARVVRLNLGFKSMQDAYAYLLELGSHEYIKQQGRLSDVQEGNKKLGRPRKGVTKL